MSNRLLFSRGESLVDVEQITVLHGRESGRCRTDYCLVEERVDVEQITVLHGRGSSRCRTDYCLAWERVL